MGDYLRCTGVSHSDLQRLNRHSQIVIGWEVRGKKQAWAEGLHDSVQDHQAPEVQRVALHQLCLTVKAILPNKGSLHSTLSLLVSPPKAEAVEVAVEDLKRMGALDQDEALTPLGQHLVKLPMHPRLGKALIYATMLRY